MEYYVYRSCYDCRQEEKIGVTKVELAFSYYRDKMLSKRPCPHCVALAGGSLGYSMVALDQELLDLWGNDSRLSFLEQDEDLVLADILYVPMMLEALDRRKYKKHKLRTLVSALCVLVYDNLGAAGTKKDAAKRQQVLDTVIPALQARREFVQRAGSTVMDYIRKAVFPLIQIDKG